MHLIGKLQSNKTAKAAEIFSAVDSVDSLRMAQRLNDAAMRLGRVLPVLLEIKLSPEESKSGLDPESPELVQLLERMPELPGLRVARPDDGAAVVGRCRVRAALFRSAAPFASISLRRAWPGLDFSQLSMGMSGILRWRSRKARRACGLGRRCLASGLMRRSRKSRSRKSALSQIGNLRAVPPFAECAKGGASPISSGGQFTPVDFLLTPEHK